VKSLKQIMKKINFLKVAEVLLAVTLTLAPAFTLAQLNTNNQALCQGTGLNCQATSVNGLIKTVINWLLGIAFGVAVLFLLLAVSGISLPLVMRRLQKKVKVRLLMPLLVL